MGLITIELTICRSYRPLRILILKIHTDNNEVLWLGGVNDKCTDEIFQNAHDPNFY